MFRLLILISWILASSTAKAAEEAPTFVIESDRFSVRQVNDFRIGNIDRELTEAEMLNILDTRAYELTDSFSVKYDHYFYFVYVVDNRSGRDLTTYVKFPLWFPLTKVWLHQNGRLVPLQAYPRWGDNFVAHLPPGVHRLIGMRLSGAEQSGKATGVRLLDFDSFQGEWRGVEFLLSAVFGGVITMIFYNFGMYLIYRRAYFLFYMLYSGLALYALAMISGYAVYDVPSLSLTGLIGSISLLFFCNSSLNLRQKFPRLFRASLVCGLLCFGLASFSMATGHWLGFGLSIPVVMGYCLLVSVCSLRGGYRPAFYFVLGWGIFLVCCIIVVLNVAFWNLPYLSWSTTFGLAAEISLFSFAIGQKVRLAEQQAMRDNQHAFNQLKKVFYPHQISKIKEGLSIEETMPTSQKEACAICFDIISSSRIESTLGRAFIGDSVKACVSALTEDYDGENMVATGYRVKEVGDGFLCTIGYPFGTFDGGDPAACTLELALKFAQIFQRQVDELAPGQLIFCSIGLAFGNVQGHFPKVGVAEYEVDGRAVDLAQRYESFRKRYFPHGPDGHIITVHSTLFDRLPSHQQEGFTRIDLRAAQIVMRDEPDATHVYYRVLSPEATRDLLLLPA